MELNDLYLLYDILLLTPNLLSYALLTSILKTNSYILMIIFIVRCSLFICIVFMCKYTFSKVRDDGADICSLNKRSRPNDTSIDEDPTVLLPLSISNNPEDDIPPDPNISTSKAYGAPNSGCEDEMKDILQSGCGDHDCNDVLMQDNTISGEIWEFLIEFDPILWSLRKEIIDTRIKEQIESRGGTFIATPATGNCLPQCCVYYNDGNFDENKSMIERFIMVNYTIQNPAAFSDIDVYVC
eukprot:55610_1